MGLHCTLVYYDLIGVDPTLLALRNFLLLDEQHHTIVPLQPSYLGQRSNRSKWPHPISIRQSKTVIPPALLRMVFQVDFL
jgi:hypothetical protein